MRSSPTILYNRITILRFAEVLIWMKKQTDNGTFKKSFFVSELENKIIEKNMREANLQNFSTYARKSCLDKKIYTVDFSSLMYLM